MEGDVRSLSWRVISPVVALALAGCVQHQAVTGPVAPVTINRADATDAIPPPISLTPVPAKKSRITKVTDPAINAQIAQLARRPVAHINRRRDFLVEARAVDRQTAETLQLQPARGVILMQVMEGGAAETSGLRAGDVIVRFSGLAVREVGDLARALTTVSRGSMVQAAVWREGAERSFLIRF